MSYFNPEHKDIGVIKTSESVKINYSFSKEIEILGVTLGCGCTSALVNNADNAIILNYTSVEIPVHLKEQGFYISTKNAEVEYIIIDSPALTHKQKLTFTVKVVGK